MHIKKLPPVAYLHNRYTYNPETGDLISNLSNTIITSKTRNGYCRVCIMKNNKKQYYLAHRIIWKMVTGEEIADGYVIDHINQNRFDNRICNLRLATIQENAYNCKREKESASGELGIYKEQGRYRVRLRVDNKLKSFGMYDTIAEARIARVEAEKKYCGEFAPHLCNNVHSDIIFNFDYELLSLLNKINENNEFFG